MDAAIKSTVEAAIKDLHAANAANAAEHDEESNGAVEGEQMADDEVRIVKKTEAEEGAGPEEAALGVSFKMELDEDQERSYNSLLTLSSLLDADVILQGVGNKIFDRYSMWDLMVEKVRHSGRYAESGALPLLIEDMERIQLEMKNLVECSLDFVSRKIIGKRLYMKPEEFFIGDFVAAALCLEPGVWQKKLNMAEVETEFALPLDTLLPKRPTMGRIPNTKKRKKKKKYVGGVPSSMRIKKERPEPGIAGDADYYYYSDTIGEAEDEFGDDMRDPGDPDFRKERKKRGKYRPREIKEPGVKREKKVKEEGDCDSKSRKARLLFHKDGENFYCKYSDCSSNFDLKAFPGRAQFEAHYLEQHMTEEDRIIPCLVEGCTELFSLTSERNNHMDRSHERLINCEFCDKTFYGFKDAQFHRKRWHTEDGKPRENNSQDELDPNCVCSKCGKKFSKPKSVATHEKTCDGIFVRQPQFLKSKVGLVWYCQEPGCTNKTAYESEYSLRMHFYDNHLREAEKLFVCEYCHQRFAFRTMLNKHVKLSHEKTHVCDFCGRKFGAKDKLTAHVFTHTGEKPYMCDKCDYRAAKKYNLDQHKQSKHQDFGVKNHYCELCGKGFVTQGRVRQHKKIIHREGRDQEVATKRKAQPKPKPVVPKPQLQVAQVTVEEQQAAVAYIPNDLHEQLGMGRWNYLYRK